MDNRSQEQVQSKSKGQVIALGKKTIKSGVNLGKMIAAIFLKKIVIPTAVVIFLITAAVLLVTAILFGSRGQFGHFNLDAIHANQWEQDGENIHLVNVSEDHEFVDIYYRFMAMQSYVKTVDDGKNLISFKDKPQDFARITDYHNKENFFYLSHFFLLSVDEIAHRLDFRYPEQFIRPVYADLENRTLNPITDEDGTLLATSYVYTQEGEKTEDKVLGVWDYGFAPILFYIKEEKEDFIKGRYIKKDVIIDNEIVQIEMDKPFRIVIPNSQREIYVIEHAITHSGEITYEYQHQDVYTRPLSNSTSNYKVEHTPDDRYFYEKGIIIVEPTMDDITDWDRQVFLEQLIDEYWIKIEVDPLAENILDPRELSQETLDLMLFETLKPYPVEVPLYKYREGHLGEFIPVETNSIQNFSGVEYLYGYLTNYQAYIPDDVIQDFSFYKRAEPDSAIIEELKNLLQFQGGALVRNYNNTSLNIGSRVNVSQYERANMYIHLFLSNGARFDIDPYILLAIAANVSGGDHLAHLRGRGPVGLMQMQEGLSVRLSLPDKTYSRVFSRSDLNDITINVEAGASYFKHLLSVFHNNPLLAIHAYGTNEATTIRMMENYAKEKNLSFAATCQNVSDAGWLERRVDYFSRNDSNFIENVLSYYPNQLSDLLNIDDVSGLSDLTPILALQSITIAEKNQNWLLRVWDNVVDGFSKTKDQVNTFYGSDYGEDVFFHQQSLSHDDVIDVLALTLSFSNSSHYYDELELFFGNNISDHGVQTDFIFLGNTNFSGGIGNQARFIEGIASGLIGFINPTQIPYRVTSPYGFRVHPVTGAYSMHNGTDYATPMRTGLYAVGDGIVTFAGWSGGYGFLVEIRSDVYRFRYAHLDKILVERGQSVSTGELIGLSGNTGVSTGAHLHFEMFFKEERTDPHLYFYR